VGSQQEIPLQLRIVAATNRPLRSEVEAGVFRADLYYRLQVVELKLPPLAAHKEDIPDLVAHFITTLAPRLGVPPIAVTYSIARRPGSSGAPDTIAAMVSSRCSFARSTTSAGSARRGVAAM
jgi:DNA-binding NtrC family response regulator